MRVLGQKHLDDFNNKSSHSRLVYTSIIFILHLLQSAVNLPLDSSNRPREPSTWLHSSVSSTGFGSHSGLSSVLPYTPTAALTVQRRSISLTGYSQSPASVRALRTRLHSESTALLHVPRSNHKTIGDRSFPVPAAKVWNSLPPPITSSPSLLQLERR